MHVIASILQGGGAAHYLLPLSDTSCVLTARIFLVHDVLYEVSATVSILRSIKKKEREP